MLIGVVHSHSRYRGFTVPEKNDSIGRRRFLGRSASIVGASSVLGAVGVGKLAAAGVDDDSQESPCGKPQRAMFEAGIVAKAWQDEEYKERLLRDPRGVLSRELETRIPSNVNVRVLEEDADTVYLVLPRNPNDYAEKRLGSEELLGVAAGWRMGTLCDTIASAAPGWFVSLDFSPRSREAQEWRKQQLEQVG